MGFKRPFDHEESNELPFKQSRQLQHSSNKLGQLAEVVPCNSVPHKQCISAELVVDDFYKSQGHEAFEGDALDEVPNYGVKEFVRRAPIPWFNSSSLVLDRSPRKQIPLGPNHQANVPSWGGQVKEEKDTFLSRRIKYNADDKKLRGTCILPMPDLDLLGVNEDNIGEGRKDCICWDGGSVRCVRQHVSKAREELLKTIGNEKFVNLGFGDMGEVVAHKWREEEEELFHGVVYFNPVSLGRNFWKHLETEFPSRSKKELVSYYFNVFMLRRRAAQNRSNLLDIDSDDDEWHGSDEGTLDDCISEDDEDSAIESPFHQDLESDPGRRYALEDDEEDEDDDDNDDGDGGVGDVIRDPNEPDYTPEPFFARTADDSRSDLGFQCLEKISVSVGEELNDDSCMSYELLSNMVDTNVVVDAVETLQPDGVKTGLSKCLQTKFDNLNDMVSLYLLEQYDVAKVWDDRYPMDPIKGIDLLPTCNIIEEIFGEGTWDNNTRNN